MVDSVRISSLLEDNRISNRNINDSMAYASHHAAHSLFLMFKKMIDYITVNIHYEFNVLHFGTYPE